MKKNKILVSFFMGSSIVCASTPLITMSSCNNTKFVETWGEEQAHIIVNKKIYLVNSLVDSNICKSAGHIIAKGLDGKDLDIPRTQFNFPLHLNPALTTIDNYFLRNCTIFNQAIVLPDSLTSIGIDFLSTCLAFNKPLILPNTLESVGTGMLSDGNKMTSCVNIQDLSVSVFQEDNKTLTCSNANYPMYQNGVEISGTNKEAFLERFPNTYENPYRNLK